ncbi:hypothetical protein [Paenibacillus aceris]|uniref:Uncharacterized protein n=1 Tax=Paenibacillus aceris TaxID=869555 RepID=A0ABS4HRU1_9BACL|nr:hypothetical protein [Paenibacillus aceris]MBP1961336.1 hypothetical protein [Paenibacillus aceris]NHW37879.1 hypothetical protein [Paenibacillus aceris]
MHHTRATRLLRTMICTLLLSVLSVSWLSPLNQTFGQANNDQTTNHPNTFLLVVKASPHATYRTEASFEDKKLQRELEKVTAGAPYVEVLPPDTTLTYSKKGQTQNYGVTVTGELVDLITKSTVTVSTGTQEALRQQVEALRAKHYGEILPWEDASKVIPKYSKFTITDVESGLSFEGQRRAGSNHADVQPLTKTDSATLKTIYGGAWSWDRKAVLVKFNGRTLAGSMHGMPHGGDGIPGNDFNGHFCIHFLGSVTHGSRSSDPAHQVMVHRAAGLLTSYISKLSPWALIDVWISAANQGDLQLLQVTTGQEQAMHVRSMRRLSKFQERDVSQLLELETAVDVTATPARASAPAHRRVLFRLERASLDSRWYIRSAVMK